MTDILPEDVPVEVVEHRFEAEDLICPDCGTEMVEIGKDVRRTLVIQPAEVSVREDWYYTYACPKCKEDNIEAPIARPGAQRSGSGAESEKAA